MLDESLVKTLTFFMEAALLLLRVLGSDLVLCLAIFLPRLFVFLAPFFKVLLLVTGDKCRISFSTGAQ